jgi:hypothetical protein
MNSINVWGFLADKYFLFYNQVLMRGAKCRLVEEFSS